jgi:hypothetical protein
MCCGVKIEGEENLNFLSEFFHSISKIPLEIGIE